MCIDYYYLYFDLMFVTYVTVRMVDDMYPLLSFICAYKRLGCIVVCMTDLMRYRAAVSKNDYFISVPT